MLVDLKVKNFAIVEDGHIEFEKGMVAFTGETGAGKSLMLDAITLLLGAKARRDLVRAGQDLAEVEGVFDLSEAPEHRERVRSLGFDIEGEDGHLLLVRREFSSAHINRNRIWIQGSSATRKQLQAVLGDLVEISGQHEFLRLGRDEFLLDLIDHYGGLRGEVRDFSALYSQYTELKAEVEALVEERRERETRLDFVNFQIEEMQKAGIGPGLEEAEQEWLLTTRKLGNVEKLSKTLGELQSLFSGLDGDSHSSGGILGSLVRAQHLLGELKDFGEQFSSLDEQVEQISTIAGEVDREFGQIFHSLESDPAELDAAEERLSQLKKLKRKFSLETDGLIAHFEQLESERVRLENSEENLSQRQLSLAQLEKRLEESAEALHERRMLAAKEMEKLWIKDIRLLGMPQAELKLGLSVGSSIQRNGNSLMTALFNANKGEKLQPLGKVASGGELSRIMLALKNIVASRSEVSVYLFDEVDAGIGGETALKVAERLKQIAADNQVLVVTHLASIASKADIQLFIEKQTQKGRTRTLIRKLSAKERVDEIARMLGQSSSGVAKKLAKEMLKGESNGKSSTKVSSKSSSKASTKSSSKASSKASDLTSEVSP